jgi:hypothetical protein
LSEPFTLCLFPRSGGGAAETSGANLVFKPHFVVMTLLEVELASGNGTGYDSGTGYESDIKAVEGVVEWAIDRYLRAHDAPTDATT